MIALDYENSAAKGSSEKGQNRQIWNCSAPKFQPRKTSTTLLRYEASLERIFDTTCASKNLRIMRDCCDNHILVQQFKSLRFKEFKGTVIDKDPPSDPMGKDRHLINCLRYTLLDDSRFTDQRGGLSTFEPIYPKLAY